MLESAMEFVEICRSHNFHNIVLSMKASFVPTMIEANKLLVSEMNKRAITIPFTLVLPRPEMVMKQG
jgi:(E)-4-hydroxy-3-methylbut-2-enyl-diphosphate synthase